MKKVYTILIFSADKAGLLNRVTIIFTRRKINIMSITASDSEVEGIHRYTIVVEETEEMVSKVVRQIEKQVDVHKAFYFDDNGIVYQEIALYKVPTELFFEQHSLEPILRKHNARVLAVEQAFVILEKTGHHTDTHALFVELQPLGLLEFVRSGRIAISKPMKELRSYLEELSEQATY